MHIGLRAFSSLQGGTLGSKRASCPRDLMNCFKRLGAEPKPVVLFQIRVCGCDKDPYKKCAFQPTHPVISSSVAKETSEK
jgi:hypothetical protein